MKRRRVIEHNDIPKAELQNALKRANPRSRLETVQCTDPKGDFSKGSADSKTDFVYPRTALGWLSQLDEEVFPTHEEDRDCLLLTPDKILKITSINKAQYFQTPPELVEGYTRIRDTQSLQEAYFRVLHDKNQISFRLGELEKTVNLAYDEKWVWHQTKARLKCISSHDLEQKLADPLFVYSALNIAWGYLGIEPLLKPKRIRYIKVEGNK